MAAGNFYARLDINANGQVVVSTAGGSVASTETRQFYFAFPFRFAQTDVTLGSLAANTVPPLGVIGTPTVTNVGEAGAPAFQNGWVNYDTNWDQARYYRSNGRVYLQGLVKNGTAGTGIFTLPVGFRPAKRALFPADGSGGYGRVDVLANGEVRHIAGGNAHFSLSNVAFRADQ